MTTKTALITLALTATAFVGFTPVAEAGTKEEILRFVGRQFIGNHHHQPHHGYASCTPHLVRTIELGRHCETRTGYRPCGAIYYYNVTVVTYRDIFSNGASRIYTRTLG